MQMRHAVTLLTILALAIPATALGAPKGDEFGKKRARKQRANKPVPTRRAPQATPRSTPRALPTPSRAAAPDRSKRATPSRTTPSVRKRAVKRAAPAPQRTTRSAAPAPARTTRSRPFSGGSASRATAPAATPRRVIQSNEARGNPAPATMRTRRAERAAPRTTSPAPGFRSAPDRGQRVPTGGQSTRAVTQPAAPATPTRGSAFGRRPAATPSTTPRSATPNPATPRTGGTLDRAFPGRTAETPARLDRSSRVSGATSGARPGGRTGTTSGASPSTATRRGTPAPTVDGARARLFGTRGDDRTVDRLGTGATAPRRVENPLFRNATDGAGRPGRDGFQRGDRGRSAADPHPIPSTPGTRAGTTDREHRFGTGGPGHVTTHGDDGRYVRRSYRKGFRDGYRIGHHDGHHDRYHDWYDRSGWRLTFAFGYGTYAGLRYHQPFHHYRTGIDFAFFYPAPVSYAYVPYGFYCDNDPVYVTHTTYVTRPEVVYETRETVYVTEVEQVEEVEVVDEVVETEAAPADPGEEVVVDARPAAGSPATEKYLRAGSGHFAAAEYYEAAVQFRLAALSAPEQTPPLFALSQALMAIKQDEYAARVLRQAVLRDPGLLSEAGDIAGVYRDAGEFRRVLEELRTRAEAAPTDGDARFLYGAQLYFTGDPQSRAVFAVLMQVMPEDQATALFFKAQDQRFGDPEALPPIESE